MRKKFWQLVTAAVAGGTMVLPGCSSGDSAPGDTHGKFVVTSAKMVDGGLIAVQFSHGVADVSSVDPRQFRLSIAKVETVPGCDAPCAEDHTSYGPDNGVRKPTRDDPGYVSWYPPIPFVAIERGSSEHELLLHLKAPLSAATCAVADYEASDPAQIGGLALHYGGAAQLDGAPVLDTDGAKLDPFGEAWVLRVVENTYYGDI